MGRLIVLNSLPKAGSNLLLNLVKAVPHTPDSAYHIPTLCIDLDADAPAVYVRLLESNITTSARIYTMHCPYSHAVAHWLRSRRARTVFLYRDLRDMIVSWVYYLESNPEHPRHAPLMALPDHDTRLMAVIEGTGASPYTPIWNEHTFPSIACLWRSFIPWRNAEGVASIAYEALLDPMTRKGTLAYLVRHLTGREKISDAALASLWRVGGDTQQSSTFRRGEAGNWREELSDAHEQRFQEVMREAG